MKKSIIVLASMLAVTVAVLAFDQPSVGNAYSTTTVTTTGSTLVPPAAVSSNANRRIVLVSCITIATTNFWLTPVATSASAAGTNSIHFNMTANPVKITAAELGVGAFYINTPNTGCVFAITDISRSTGNND